MTVATLMYAHQAAPWDSPLSLGVQSFIEYNGYVINDRRQADRIRVTGIVGLDGPDITDERENVPGDEGEFVYDSQYRGRTFVMSGDISAGSLGVLEALERDLKAAFAPLVEAPMKFRWFDVYDSFDDPQTLQNYTARIGSSASLLVSAGVLRWPTTANTLLTRSADNRLWADAVTTVRVIVGSTADASIVYTVPCFIDANNYVQVAYNVGSGTAALTVSVIVAGVKTVLATTPVTGLVQGQSVWLQARKDGDLITAELWTTPPANSTQPTFTTSTWLAGSDSDAFGDQVLSQVGFGAQTVGTSWALDDFRVGSICPCDVIFFAKPMTKPSIKESQDSPTQFKRSFQLTMKTSKPYAKCATQSRSQILVPSSGNTTQLGFGAPLTAPLSARTIIPSSVQLQNQLLFVRNRGTAPERPLIAVYGAISNLILLNLTNGQQINWTGSLADGDYLLFDCVNRTLVNAVGTNQKQYLVLSVPQWMWLEPGWNDIYIAGAGYSANTKLLIWHRGSWI